VARLLYQTKGRKDEEVGLITSASTAQLDASHWLAYKRGGWGIENGLHQRLDVSYNDDRCRVQSDRGILVLAIFRRIAVSLYVEWQSHQKRPHHVTTTDFQSLMAENHRTKAIRFTLNKRPSLKSPS
jgi:hypothetical protein